MYQYCWSIKCINTSQVTKVSIFFTCQKNQYFSISKMSPLFMYQQYQYFLGISAFPVSIFFKHLYFLGINFFQLSNISGVDNINQYFPCMKCINQRYQHFSCIQSTNITTLLLGHSNSTYLFGMCLRYQWCYLCFLPILCSSHWWGLGIRHLGSRNISHTNLSNRNPTFVTWLGEGDHNRFAI